MEGFVLEEPCVICPCGKTYLPMSDEQREAYNAALEKLKEKRNIREEPVDQASERKEKTDE